jgi:acyl-CoA thioester hydrolase
VINERIPAENRADYAVIHNITTRWIDNDMYGHVNNVMYYSYFDTAVNTWLINAGLLAPVETGGNDGQAIGLVVKTQCSYFKPISFPDMVTVGMRVGRIGTSSVCYELAIFRNGENTAAAQGHLVHVYVDRVTRRPMPLPAVLREKLRDLVISVLKSGFTQAVGDC